MELRQLKYSPKYKEYGTSWGYQHWGSKRRQFLENRTFDDTRKRGKKFYGFNSNEEEPKMRIS